MGAFAGNGWCECSPQFPSVRGIREGWEGYRRWFSELWAWITRGNWCTFLSNTSIFVYIVMFRTHTSAAGLAQSLAPTMYVINWTASVFVMNVCHHFTRLVYTLHYYVYTYYHFHNQSEFTFCWVFLYSVVPWNQSLSYHIYYFYFILFHIILFFRVIISFNYLVFVIIWLSNLTCSPSTRTEFTLLRFFAIKITPTSLPLWGSLPKSTCPVLTNKLEQYDFLLFLITNLWNCFPLPYFS